VAEHGEEGRRHGASLSRSLEIDFGRQRLGREAKGGMIQLLQARNFRMLRSNSVALQPYQVLVGQNATGKSTLLEALQFLTEVVKYGVRHPVEQRASSFYDLCFDPAEPVSLAVELSVPDAYARERRLRYEIEIGITLEFGLQVLRENLFLLPSIGNPEPPRLEEGDFSLVREDGEIPRRWKRVISKSEDGTVLFRAETGRKEYTFRVGVGEAALHSLLGDPDLFPLSLAGRHILEEGIWILQLDAVAMRGVSSPGEATTIYPDGSNLARVIQAFKLRDPVLYEQWVRHVGTAIEGLNRSMYGSARRTDPWSSESFSQDNIGILFRPGCCRTERFA
jgi:hypothetical protein